MNSDEKGAKESASPVMGLLPVLILGAALGYAATLKFPADAWADRIALFSLGLVGAYVLLNAIDLALNVPALRADPIPAALNVADRDAVRAQADRLSGRAAVAGRARNLLRSWGLGGRPPQVVGLAGFQGAQARHQLYAGALFAALLLAVSAAAGAQRPLCGCLGLALGVIVLARQGLSLRVDRYIEDRLLSRLPAEIPRTAMTAAELAGALGGAIQEAFKKHVPQPEQMASAVQHAMEGAMRNVASAVEKLQKALGENQSVLSEKWAQTIASAAAAKKCRRLLQVTSSPPTSRR